jgi:uncharacterized protein (UPF0332 family)
VRFSEELIQHAIRLLGNPPGSTTKIASNVDMRRAVSASYYALFHHLSEAAVEQIAPYASTKAANRIHRWLDHGEMKKICREFASPQLNLPLRDLLDGAASEDMQTLAVNFIRLQEARHNADYDLDYQLSWEQAREFIELATHSIGAWNRIAASAEANIFILSLLLWKNWQKDRT